MFKQFLRSLLRSDKSEHLTLDGDVFGRRIIECRHRFCVRGLPKELGNLLVHTCFSCSGSPNYSNEKPVTYLAPVDAVHRVLVAVDMFHE